MGDASYTSEHGVGYFQVIIQIEYFLWDISKYLRIRHGYDFMQGKSSFERWRRSGVSLNFLFLTDRFKFLIYKFKIIFLVSETVKSKFTTIVSVM